ncbi:MAG: zf-HC2 domain-containing protein [Oscillospiraceae bacterium]|nr:zf-HC2 domain-containing protein [Oscillospiraceae bacterium]
MKHCTEYLESISAYADGELTSPEEIREVETHLLTCKNCAAFYSFSREISIVTEESSARPPYELTSLVMAQINAESAHGNTNQAYNQGYPKAHNQAQNHAVNSRRNANGYVTPSRQNREKKSNMKVVLTRVVPLAACLAIVVLVWQFWGNIGGEQQLDFAAGLPAAADMAPAAPAALDAPAEDADETWRVSAEVAEEAEMESFVDEFDDADDALILRSESVPEETEPSAEASPGGGANGVETYIYRGEPYPYTFEDSGVYPYPHVFFGYIDDLTEEELEFIETRIAYASYIIGIFPPADLPYIMQRFDQLEGVTIAEWNMVFEITTDQALLLLSELGYGAITHVRLDQNMRNPYAIVLFSRQ